MISPNYSKATQMAHVIFATKTNHTFPVNVVEIINNLENVRISTYDEFAKSINQTVEFVSQKIAKNTDGFTLCRGSEYIVVYNSNVIDNVFERIRFTISHEIGHIVLGHFFGEKTLLQRGGISEADYKVLEKEADTFAQELLAPMYLINPEWSVDYVRNSFDVSKAVSENIISSKKRRPWIKPTKSVENLYYRNGIIINKRVSFFHEKCRDSVSNGLTWLQEIFIRPNYYFCPHCNNVEKTRVEELLYCPVCGSNALEFFSESDYFYFHETKERKTMSYSSLQVDSDGRLSQNCPICGNDHLSDNFCSVCGIDIINRCSGKSKSENDTWNGGYENSEPCEISLLGSDRYCPKCGCESTFLYYGLLKEWDYIPSPPPTFLQEFQANKLPFSVKENDLPF